MSIALDQRSPEYDVVILNVEDTWHLFLGEQYHKKKFFNVHDPIWINLSLYAYRVKKGKHFIFDPAEAYNISLLKPKSFGHHIIVQSVFNSLPLKSQSQENLTALFDCSYRAHDDFSNIAYKYNSPISVIPMKNLIFDPTKSIQNSWNSL